MGKAASQPLTSLTVSSISIKAQTPPPEIKLYIQNQKIPYCYNTQCTIRPIQAKFSQDAFTGLQGMSEAKVTIQ
jgi:hypothetical protein